MSQIVTKLIAAGIGRREENLKQLARGEGRRLKFPFTFGRLLTLSYFQKPTLNHLGPKKSPY